MRAVEAHPDLELQLVVGASALLDRYGTVLDVIEEDGFEPDEKVFMLIEGETPGTMAKSTGLGLLELPTAFERLEPDLVITVGDRFETMATALAATYMNIPLAHTMGGEVSGNIDESIRHAVTKFAHIHFPACTDAAERIVRMGEDPETVHTVGCPRMDLVAEVLAEPHNGLSDLFARGVGGTFTLDEPFLLVSQHPVTTEYGDGERQISETLRALQQLELPAIVLWPNADAGAEHIARGIRKFREHEDDSRLHFFKNLPTDDYIQLMQRTACLIGNSSSAIREGSFIGTPSVNIGARQDGRQRGSNVLDVGYDRGEIADAVAQQVEHGSYGHEPIYGDGHAGERIADVLAGVRVELQKRITY
jgi:UDP-hydrolysing UDP-N-acetyl-D-glucosamine 2-epimerase